MSRPEGSLNVLLSLLNDDDVEAQERIVSLFEADCVERVIPYYERRYASDPRPRHVVEVVRSYACGQATIEELNAARVAVEAASYERRQTAIRSGDDGAAAVACAAACYAALRPAMTYVKEVARLAWEAVRTGAKGDAATNTPHYRADAAIWDAARDDEQWWQVQRLGQYLTMEDAMNPNDLEREACSTQGPLPAGTGITCPRCGAGYGDRYPIADSAPPANQLYCPVCCYTWAEGQRYKVSTEQACRSETRSHGKVY